MKLPEDVKWIAKKLPARRFVWGEESPTSQTTDASFLERCRHHGTDSTHCRRHVLRMQSWQGKSWCSRSGRLITKPNHSSGV
jgi:hypothetical protein